MWGRRDSSVHAYRKLVGWRGNAKVHASRKSMVPPADTPPSVCVCAPPRCAQVTLMSPATGGAPPADDISAARSARSSFPHRCMLFVFSEEGSSHPKRVHSWWDKAASEGSSVRLSEHLSFSFGQTATGQAIKLVSN